MSTSKGIWTIVFIFGVIGLIVCAFRGVGANYVQQDSTVYRQYAHVDNTDKTEWKGVTVDMTLPESERAADVQQQLEAQDDELAPGTADETTDPPDAEAVTGGMVPTGVEDRTITVYRKVDPIAKNDPGVTLSWIHTIGVWIAGLLTLCVLSFLWGDNPLYKTAESLVIGTSAAYVMVAAFWPMIVELLLGNLVPDLIRAVFYPGLNSTFTWYYIFPAAMCLLLLMRLSPTGGWIARWPLAFFIGVTAGFRLLSHLESDFTEQVQAAIVPLVVFDDGGFDFWASVTNIIMTLGVLVTLVYFFFSIEHKGIVGKTARVGIWFLMITFGAAFGMTVMGRIALIAERFQFLVDDWLWIIDPTGKRAAMLLSLLT